MKPEQDPKVEEEKVVGQDKKATWLDWVKDNAVVLGCAGAAAVVVIVALVAC